MNFGSKEDNKITTVPPFYISKKNIYQNPNDINISNDIKLMNECKGPENYYEQNNFQNQNYEYWNITNDFINNEYYYDYNNIYDYGYYYNDVKNYGKQPLSEKNNSKKFIYPEYHNNISKDNNHSKEVSQIISRALFSNYDNYYKDYNLDDTYQTNDTDNIYYNKNNFNYNYSDYNINNKNNNNYSNINSDYFNNNKNNYNIIDYINGNYTNNNGLKEESYNLNTINDFYQDINYYEDSLFKRHFNRKSNINEKSTTRRININHIKNKIQFSSINLEKNHNYSNYIKKENTIDKNDNKNIRIKSFDEKIKKNDKKNIIDNIGNTIINTHQNHSKREKLVKFKIDNKSQDDSLNKNDIKDKNNKTVTINKEEKSNFPIKEKNDNLNNLLKRNIFNKKNKEIHRTLTNYSYIPNRRKDNRDNKLISKNESKIKNISSRKHIYKISNNNKLKLNGNHFRNNIINNTNKTKACLGVYNRHEMVKKNLLANIAKKECDKCFKKIDSHLFKIHYNSHPSEIFRWLYLGTFSNACDIIELRRMKINYILNCAFECNNKNLPKDIKELHLKVKDLENFELYDFFEQANEFINKCKLEGGILLVHCKYGISRSASFVIAYLIKYMRYTVDDALKFVSEKRSQIKPNKGFLLQLYNYEEYYLGKRKKN